jgi:two-component system sensor histidine kinase KdpD
VRAYVLAVVCVAIATTVGQLASPWASHADQAMVYLLTILVAALGGRGPGLTAAVLSAAAFDFFFVAPYHTFAVADRSFLITFGVMLAIGIAIGSLVNRIRVAEAESRERALRAKAEELRSTLLSSVSHDLRTPLAVITGMATSLRDEAPFTESSQQRDELDTIISEAQRLSRILTNLLAITKVESGAQPRREWVPLDELIGSSLARLDDELVDHPITLDVSDELAHVDPLLTEQLLVNLVENATKHTPSGSAIEVHARRDGAAAMIEVSDRGPGLPEGPPEQVFEKFFRGRGVKAGGVGLGLTVCRAIATAHNGRIEASSRPDGGATFRVWFPDDGAPPQLADEPDDAGGAMLEPVSNAS